MTPSSPQLPNSSSEPQPFEIDPLELPGAIANHLIAIALADHAPVYLQVSLDGHLLSSRGPLQKYGLDGLMPDEYIGKTFYYLEGFFPLAQTEVMHFVQLEPGLIVDIHIVAGPESGWVLILDTTAEAARSQQIQQKRHDLSLHHHQSAKRSHQHSAPQFDIS